ncbi:MAG: methyl-accepting chemotaxis protein [Thermodesulfobacteriota bacterium]
MNSKKFMTRVLTVILAAVTFHILGIEFLIFFVMAPSVREFAAMLLYPLPLAVALIIAYIVITGYFLKPVLLLLRKIENGSSPEDGLLALAQDRCINLSYFLSGLSFPAYIIGGGGGVWIIRQIYPHWPPHIMVYGFLAGIIAGLLTIPMSQAGTDWAIQPAMETMKDIPGFDLARSAGIGVPLRVKFVIIVVVMVIGITGYSAIIGYNRVTTVIDNMQQIEALLPVEAASLLTDKARGSEDTRIKSSAFFLSRMGSLKLLFIGIILIGSLLSLVVAYAAADAMTRPLKMFAGVAERIKNGRFNETIAIISNDEFAELGASFNRMTDTLLTHLKKNELLINSIGEAVDILNPLSQELVSIADQHALGSIQQAAATENAEESGRKIAETARQIAENAADVARSSAQTRDNTREARQRLTETGVRLEEIAGKMEHIARAVTLLKQQSQEIDGIVEAIKKISGKTNILSLNAGIEAIKSGEAGRRFGMVAEEIRQLAQDTGKSAKRIRKNIERIQESVAMSITYARAGEQSVGDGKNAMKQMTAQFEEIARANEAAVRDLETIEAMTAEQAQANEKLNGILSTIRLTAHDTSASSEQTHSSIKDLKRLINQLRSHTRLHQQ